MSEASDKPLVDGGRRFKDRTTKPIMQVDLSSK